MTVDLDHVRRMLADANTYATDDHDAMSGRCMYIRGHAIRELIETLVPAMLAELESCR